MADLFDALHERVASEAALFDEIVNLTVSRDSYRLLAQQAIHQLAERQAEVDRQRAQIAALRDEIRRYVTAKVAGRAA